MFRKLRRETAARRTTDTAALVTQPTGIGLDVVVPVADVAGAKDPVAAIVASPEHRQAAEMFGTHPFWSDRIFSEYGVSLLYALVRNLKPDVVLEIGSYRGKTAYALAHALETNGKGKLYTLGPFDSDHFLPLYARWPEALRARVDFRPVNSAAFFAERQTRQIEFDLVLVDGNHDFEYALFDLQCAARQIAPGGFIAADNITQAGPMRAVLQFLRDNPEWTDCAPAPGVYALTQAFDQTRPQIWGTDVVVLRAPPTYLATAMPRTFGERPWAGNVVLGVETNCDAPLVVQCILRSFGAEQHEAFVTATGSGRITFDAPLTIAENPVYTTEIWVQTRSGSAPLGALPTVF